MRRHPFALRVAEGKTAQFRATLGKVWPELKQALEACGARNFSLWSAGQLVFGYYETGEPQGFGHGETGELQGFGHGETGEPQGLGSEETGDAVAAGKGEADLEPQIFDCFRDCIEWISAPWQEMRLMYQNIGVIRENKELIRHRVFMTRLKPGCAEEYRRRHAALEEARGEVPDPGPDSNFTIWSAGGYIFGYDEIDTTMEKDQTAEDLEGTRSWETRQLEIMDWITNDVDWLTGEVHPACVCIARFR